MSSRFMHVVAMCQNCLFKAEQCPMIVYILYFAYPSIDRHLGWFYLLAIINTAAVKMGIQISLWSFLSLWGIYLGVELLDHMVTLFNFLRGYHTFSIMNVPIYIPTNGASNFSTSLSKIVLFCFLDSQPTGCEVVLYLIFFLNYISSYRRVKNMQELSLSTPFLFSHHSYIMASPKLRENIYVHMVTNDLYPEFFKTSYQWIRKWKK